MKCLNRQPLISSWITKIYHDWWMQEEGIKMRHDMKINSEESLASIFHLFLEINYAQIMLPEIWPVFTIRETNWTSRNNDSKQCTSLNIKFKTRFTRKHCHIKAANNCCELITWFTIFWIGWQFQQATWHKFFMSKYKKLC